MPIVRFFTGLAPQMAENLTRHAPAGYEVTTHASDLPDNEAIPLLKDADFLIVFGKCPSDDALRSASNLKLVQLVSAGYEHINVDLCKELGIQVANNGGANSIDVAEHTIALILGYYRHFIKQDPNVRNNRYKALNNGQDTFTIHGKTVGIIGLGNIGQRTAHLLNAFGATLLYSDAYRAKPEIEEKYAIAYTSLDDLLSKSDIVSLHVPLLDSTRNLIGEKELAHMKSTALLVNTCRGGVVDQKALTQALQNNQIMGAALDVLESEPPAPNDPILELDNVLLTPHSAGVTFDTWSRRGEFVFQNLQKVENGHSPDALIS